MNTQTTNNEIWRTIGLTNYQVSNLGRIRNQNERILTPSSNGQKKNDYQFIIIGDKKNYIHQLVLQAFIGDKPKGFECDHINGNKLDNSIDNLRYLTVYENRSHKGESHPQSKLNNEKVIAIRTLPFLLKDITHKRIGEIFNVSASTISAVLSKKTWSHV